MEFGRKLKRSYPKRQAARIWFRRELGTLGLVFKKNFLLIVKSCPFQKGFKKIKHHRPVAVIDGPESLTGQGGVLCHAYGISRLGTPITAVSYFCNT